MIDEVVIKVQAGKGGDGLVSFRREKYVPRGGPDGGDGGRGGDIIFICSSSVNTLSQFARVKSFKAEDGEPGRRAKRTGKDASDLILKLPPGTIIREKIGEKWKTLADLKKEEEQVLICRGGRGGWGNYHFATSTHQTPREANPGVFGQKKTLKLELKLIADIGIIGLPNCGKSTLLARLSSAHPKIADYPFTTLEPNLGVVNGLVFADIPGLIEGASKGKGLGDQFLHHIERTKILVHLIDVTNEDLEKSYQIIRKELADFSPKFLRKKEIIVLNKIDVLPDWQNIHKRFIKIHKPLAISAVSGLGLPQFLTKISAALK